MMSLSGKIVRRCGWCRQWIDEQSRINAIIHIELNITDGICKPCRKKLVEEHNVGKPKEKQLRTETRSRHLPAQP